MRVPYHEYFPGERSRRGKSLFIHRIWKAVDLIDIHNFSFRRNFLLEKIILIKSFQNWNFSIPVLIFPPPLARLSYWRLRLWPRCEAAVVWLICYDPVTTCRRTGGRHWLASPQRSHSQSSHLYQLLQTIRTSRREETSSSPTARVVRQTRRTRPRMMREILLILVRVVPSDDGNESRGNSVLIWELSGRDFYTDLKWCQRFLFC